MPLKKNTNPTKSSIRLPKQGRAKLTVELILESAFQILETDGLEHFKVARLAERSGYSVGTLYQYFDSIDAVMLALVESEHERQRQTLLARFGDLAAQGVAQSTADLVQVMLNAFSGRRAAQRAIIEWAVSRPYARQLDSRNSFLGQLLASVSARSQGLEFSRLLTKVEMFVLSRAFLNTFRTAMWDEEVATDTAEFAQGLTDLVDGYIQQLARRDEQQQVALAAARRERQ